MRVLGLTPHKALQAADAARTPAHALQGEMEPTRMPRQKRRQTRRSSGPICRPSSMQPGLRPNGPAARLRLPRAVDDLWRRSVETGADLPWIVRRNRTPQSPRSLARIRKPLVGITAQAAVGHPRRRPFPSMPPGLPWAAEL